MAQNGWTFQKLLEWLEIASNGWKWLEIARKAGNSLKLILGLALDPKCDLI